MRETAIMQEIDRHLLALDALLSGDARPIKAQLLDISNAIATAWETHRAAITNGLPPRGPNVSASPYETISSLLQISDSAADRIAADPDLSETGKAKALADVRARIAEQGQSTAVSWMNDLTSQETRARERLDALSASHRLPNDVQADSLALERARILAEDGTWEEVVSAFQEAADARSLSELRAFSAVAPIVRNRFASDHRYSAPAARLAADAKRALGALEAPEVSKARAEYEQAQAATNDARRRLDSLRWRYGERGQRVNWLDSAIDGERVVMQHVTQEGKRVITISGGRWL